MSALISIIVITDLSSIPFVVAAVILSAANADSNYTLSKHHGGGYYSVVAMWAEFGETLLRSLGVENHYLRDGT